MAFNHISYTPRWLVLLADLGLSFLSVLTATALFFNFDPERMDWSIVAPFFLVIMGVRAGSFLISRSYSGIIRYTGSQDVLRIVSVLTAGEIVLAGLTSFFYVYYRSAFIPLEVLAIEYLTLSFLMIAGRLLFKKAFAQYFSPPRKRKGILIYGANEYGLMVKHILCNPINAAYHVVAFVDSDLKKEGKVLSGVKIHRHDDLQELLENNEIEKIVIAQRLLSARKKADIARISQEHHAKAVDIPNFEKLLNGELDIRQITDINVERLLNRGCIELDDHAIREELLDKTVLVTGAAGSIGSEIVRQLTSFNPKKIILLDSAETPLYNLELELTEDLEFFQTEVELGTICDRGRLEKLFSRYRPDIVFHAAAYKHVPMVENMPLEGIKTNIMGTINVADMAHKYECNKFVMVSTDKAVNPANVMGCTKRIAEIYIQSLNEKSDTAFITTRFGNVLGSNGSVIPRFTRQIQSGGPVTLTHPEITRFFMTITEACQLVLQAGALGQGGEIFVFNMGESVKILSLAKNMIRMAGLEPGKDIQIVYTGLRPGEKLYEEVLGAREPLMRTPHKLILRARVQEHDYDTVKKDIESLRSAVLFENTMSAIRIMKQIVPEFKSNNSVYQSIDAQQEDQAITLNEVAISNG